MNASTTVLMPGCAIASTGRRPASDPSAREVFQRFVDLLYRRRLVRAAFESCVVARGFVDHGPQGFGGRADAMTQLGQQFAAAGAEVEVLHTVFERDIGVVHAVLRETADRTPHRRVDIFRLAEGRIVEHWEVAA